MITGDHERLASWATDQAGAVALVLRQTLLPVEGPGAVIFPPTYANNRKIPYNIDELADGTKVALVDSVASQANRMEPLFIEPPLKDFVPQITVRVKTASHEAEIPIFEIGHRVADALVRSSGLRPEVDAAFEALARNDAWPMARLAPTSLIFGAWDSRGGGVKVPRVVSSVIRAWNVEPLTRSAQYVPPVDYAALGVFGEKDLEKAEGDPKNPLAKAGFVHVPSVDQHGGIVVHGEIIREVTVNLVAVRRLEAADEERTARVRRYILGLALAVVTADVDPFLRQGCMLVPDPDRQASWQVVNRDGKRNEVVLDRNTLLEWTREQAVGMQLPGPRSVDFDATLARQVVEETKKKKG